MGQQDANLRVTRDGHTGQADDPPEGVYGLGLDDDPRRVLVAMTSGSAPRPAVVHTTTITAVTDIATVLGRIAFLDESMKILISSHLARTPEVYGVIYDELLSSIPVARRIKVLGLVVKEIGEDADWPVLKTELLDLFATRNVFAHTIWMYSSPFDTRWEGIIGKATATHVSVVQAELLALMVRIEAAHAKLRELQGRLPSATPGKANPTLSEVMDGVMRNVEADSGTIASLLATVDRASAALRAEAEVEATDWTNN